jgi:hypothetical protein
MGRTRNAQTMAKRARELAVKERRDRKREKKAAATHEDARDGNAQSNGPEVGDGEPGDASGPPSAGDP